MQSILVPKFWEQLLQSYVKKTFYTDTRKKGFAEREGFTEGDYRFFARGVEKLNVAFTQERGSLPKNYLNQKEFRSGYLLYFVPVNALKVASLLHPLLTKEGEGGGLSLRILDLGSGPGTGLLGTMAALEEILKRRKEGRLKVQWVLVDQNREALNDAAVLHQGALAHLKEAHPGWVLESDLQRVAGNLFADRLPRLLPPQEFDLVLALNFLNELPSAKRIPILETVLRGYLKPTGRILVMEPALQRTTRELMELHDDLLGRKSCFVCAPCLHQAACPMLEANNRDWCHTYIPWERPEWIERLDALVGIRKDYLKCSYLLLGKETPAAAPPHVWRVVSGPLNSKGKSERLLCGPGGLPRLKRAVRLDRHCRLENRWFDQVARGDILSLSSDDKVIKLINN